MATPRPTKAIAKKAGPLPIWAWALLGAGGLLAVYLVLRRNTEQTGAGVQLVTGNVGKPQDAASGGYPQGVTPAAQMLSEDVLWEIAGSLAHLSEKSASLDDRLVALGQSTSEQHSTLGDKLVAVKDQVAQTVAGAALGSPAVSTPTALAAGSAPKPPANQQAPTRYYTYKPGAAPAGRKRDEAPKGARLGFEPGRGYFVVK